MKRIQFVALCVATTFCVSAAQQIKQAHLFEYDYEDTSQKDSIGEPLVQPVDKADRNYELNSKDKNPQSSYPDYRPQSSDTLAERLTEISTNADGVEIFMDALDQVMMGEENVVKIPEKIDPEQHTISLEDAFDRMEEFLTEQMEETQNFLSEINDAIDQKKMPKSPTNVKSNKLSSIALYRLLKAKNDLMNIIETYTESSEDLRNYRLSQSLDEVYNYYYDSTEIEEAEEMDKQQEIYQMENEFSGEPPAVTTQTDLNYETTGKSAELSDAGNVDETAAVATPSVFNYETKDSFSIQLLNAEHEYFISEIQNDYTEISIYKAKDGDHMNLPTRMFISIGIGVFAVCVCLLFLISVLYRRYIQRRMFATKPIYRAKSFSKITVVPVYENEISHTHRPQLSPLPGYLEVISGRIHNPSDLSDIDDKPTGDKIALIA